MNKWAGLWLLVLFVVCLQYSWAGWMPTIADILEHPERFLNQTVAIQGKVVDSRVAADEFNPRIKGEFRLQDQTGGQILVRTYREPPPNDKLMLVKGVVISYGDGVAIEQRSVLPGSPLLWGALAVLVVLAIVLIVLLVRSPGRLGPAIVYEEPESERPGDVQPPEPKKTCPACGAVNDTDARYCEQCQAQLEPVAPGAGPTVTVPGGSGASLGQGETVVLGPEESPVIADLFVLEGEGAREGTRFALRKGRQKIGRREDMEIRLYDDAVSREHALIWWEDGRFFIQDLASTGGTFVNGEKISRAPLVDGDTVQMGRTKLVFRMIAPPKE
jgi:hypothetical protein